MIASSIEFRPPNLDLDPFRLRPPNPSSERKNMTIPHNPQHIDDFIRRLRLHGLIVQVAGGVVAAVGFVAALVVGSGAPIFIDSAVIIGVFSPAFGIGIFGIGALMCATAEGLRALPASTHG